MVDMLSLILYMQVRKLNEHYDAYKCDAAIFISI